MKFASLLLASSVSAIGMKYEQCVRISGVSGEQWIATDKCKIFGTETLCDCATATLV